MRRNSQAPHVSGKSFKKNYNKQLFGYLLIGLVLSFLPLLQVSYAATPEPKYVPDRLLIKFNPNIPQNIRQSILDENGATTIDEISQIDVKVIRVPENALQGIENALEKNPSVEYVERDFILEPTMLPNDPSFSNQWHLAKINMPSAWDITTGTGNVRIAILDTGVDPTHPDLAGKLVAGYNFYDNNNNWSDVCGHGTKTAGTAAAITNNGLGVAGVGWDNSIIPIRISDLSCYGYYSAMTKGITYAADNGAKVANISFQVFNGAALTDAAKYMYNKGGWVVVSGGNTGIFENYSDNPYVISVGATDSSDRIATFSSNGPYIDFSAPGVGIYTTAKGGTYASVSGTSFSAPITAGVISLMYSANPTMTPSQVYTKLKETAVDLGAAGYDNYYGWGRVDASKAVQILSVPIDTTPPTVSITTPLDGSTISGSVTVGVDATDNVGVSKVALYIDDLLYGEDVNTPYDFALDTTKLQNGVHLMKAVAYDINGNTASSQITINVSNASATVDTTPPTVSITSLADGSTVKGAVTVSVLAADSSGISKVELYVDGVLKATLTKQPYDFSLNTRSVKDGLHTVIATAYDAYTNSASATISVTVANRK